MLHDGIHEGIVSEMPANIVQGGDKLDIVNKWSEEKINNAVEEVIWKPVKNPNLKKQF